MAKAPSFQFYPADWRNNANLRRCSEAARGAWVDILCILHDQDEYGIVRWPMAELAKAAGIPLRLAKELAEKSVLKGSDKGIESFIFTPRHAGKDGEPVTLIAESKECCWYSSRLVRDNYIRHSRGASTRFTSNNNPNKPPKDPSPTRPIGDGEGTPLGDGPSSSSSSSSSNKRENAGAEDFFSGNQNVNEGKPSLPPARPSYAPSYEDASQYFYQQGEPDLVEAFMVENDKTGWTYRDGREIVFWQAWAAGFIRKAQKAKAKAVQQETKKPKGKQSTYVMTRRDFYTDAEWEAHLEKTGQNSAA